MPNNVRQKKEGLPPADPAKTAKSDKIDLRISAEQRRRWSEFCITTGREMPEWIRTTLDIEAQETESVRVRRQNLASSAACTVLRLQAIVGHGASPIQGEVQKLRSYLDAMEDLVQ